MNNLNQIVDDSSLYGRKGHTWHPAFVSYMVDIVNHPNYAGMPDAVDSRGLIQWEAPSNRKSGVNRWTHNRRKKWWEDKAHSLGISTTSGKWISRTAKAIHPFGEKPCKRCGELMSLSYVYPNMYFTRRLEKKIPNFPLEKGESIDELFLRLVESEPDIAVDVFLDALHTKPSEPSAGTPESIQRWLVGEAIPAELRSLSPGAMSNAPDRFDGFHSFNRCCRSSADTGRSTHNMRSYSTDRRAFEYWVEGNWVAADKLMGRIQVEMSAEAAADGGDGPPTADHVGPISLGFQHRPEFRLLSRSANSARNNRMTLEDLKLLKAAESRSERVASLHADFLWTNGKSRVVTNEHALRLSKMLRDNQRNWVYLLGELLRQNHYALLATFLELEYADFDYDFTNLSVSNYMTVHTKLVAKPSNSSYTLKQKVRRTRVGFNTLRSYQTKLNRQNVLLFTDEIAQCIAAVKDTLITPALEVTRVDDQIRLALSEPLTCDYALAETIAAPEFTTAMSDPDILMARSHVAAAMTSIGGSILNLWDDARYVRASSDFDIDLL